MRAAMVSLSFVVCLFILATGMSFVGCTRRGGPPVVTDRPATADPTLSSLAATLLASQFNQTGTTATAQGDTVRFQNHTLTLRVTPTEVVSQPDHLLAVIDVQVDLDGRSQPAFHTASVGRDHDRQEAFHHAVREWLVAVGVPLVDALRTLGDAVSSVQEAQVTHGDAGLSPTLRLGPYRVFPGPTGVRGERQPDQPFGTPAMHQALLRAIEPALDELIPRSQRAEFHSLRFTIHVRNGAVGEADCRTDGVVSPRLCDRIRTVAWPRGEYECLVRQFYVLSPPTL